MSVYNKIVYIITMIYVINFIFITFVKLILYSQSIWHFIWVYWKLRKIEMLTFERLLEIKAKESYDRIYISRIINAHAHSHHPLLHIYWLGYIWYNIRKWSFMMSLVWRFDFPCDGMLSLFCVNKKHASLPPPLQTLSQGALGTIKYGGLFKTFFITQTNIIILCRLTSSEVKVWFLLSLMLYESW